MSPEAHSLHRTDQIDTWQRLPLSGISQCACRIDVLLRCLEIEIVLQGALDQHPTGSSVNSPVERLPGEIASLCPWAVPRSTKLAGRLVAELFLAIKEGQFLFCQECLGTRNLAERQGRSPPSVRFLQEFRRGLA